MKNRVRVIASALVSIVTALLALTVIPFATAGEDKSTVSTASAGGRAMVVSLEAEVAAIDLATREVSLTGPLGDTVTVTAPESAVQLDRVKVGDKVHVEYLAALEGEVRKPTSEELAQPWVVTENNSLRGEGDNAAVGQGRQVRAVCTIEGMNRLLRTIVIKDPRGKVHVIDDVEPEKMEGVTLGQTLVVVYTEAVALSLEPVAGAQ